MIECTDKTQYCVCAVVLKDGTERGLSKGVLQLQMLIVYVEFAHYGNVL